MMDTTAAQCRTDGTAATTTNDTGPASSFLAASASSPSSCTTKIKEESFIKQENSNNENETTETKECGGSTDNNNPIGITKQESRRESKHLSSSRKRTPPSKISAIKQEEDEEEDKKLLGKGNRLLQSSAASTTTGRRNVRRKVRRLKEEKEEDPTTSAVVTPQPLPGKLPTQQQQKIMPRQHLVRREVIDLMKDANNDDTATAEVFDGVKPVPENYADIQRCNDNDLGFTDMETEHLRWLENDNDGDLGNGKISTLDCLQSNNTITDDSINIDWKQFVPHEETKEFPKSFVKVLEMIDRFPCCDVLLQAAVLPSDYSFVYELHDHERHGERKGIQTRTRLRKRQNKDHDSRLAWHRNKQAWSPTNRIDLCSFVEVLIEIASVGFSSGRRRNKTKTQAKDNE